MLEAKVEFKGHQIAVRISSMDDPSSKLYIDGKVVDSCKVQSGKGALLRGGLEHDGTNHVVEILRRRIFTWPRIIVDGTELPRLKD